MMYIVMVPLLPVNLQYNMVISVLQNKFTKSSKVVLVFSVLTGHEVHCNGPSTIWSQLCTAEEVYKVIKRSAGV